MQWGKCHLNHREVGAICVCFSTTDKHLRTIPNYTTTFCLYKSLNCSWVLLRLLPHTLSILSLQVTLELTFGM